MKKIFFSFLAIAALASCAKTEAVFTQDNSEIKIAPVTAMNTKAQAGVIDGIEYPASETFNVYAYWANQPAGSLFEADETTAGAYLSNVTFVNKGMYWGGATTQYWPKNGSLRFAAYSPADKINNMTHNLAADTYELNGFTYPTTVGEMYDILVAPTSKSYTAQTAAENVSVVFEHALSWITFKLESTEVAKNKFTVTDVIMNDVNNHGNMVADMKAGTKTWSTAMPQAVNVFNRGNGTAVTTTAAIFENAGSKGTQLLVLPQPTTTVTIKFTQNPVGDAPALENQTLTLPLTLAGDEPWEAGKHYTYTVKFDLDEILINPSVEEWEEVTVPTIDATATEVANQEELQAAVAAGRNVRLTDNINLTKSIVIGNSVVTKAAGPVSVVIDLNGKNIIAESTDAIVVDNGASLEINGNGKVWAATDDKSSANAVWVKHGNVTINGGDYYVGKDNTTRNDCIYIGAAAYVADAATKVSTVTINGGKFEAAAHELNQYWVLNIKNEFTSSRFYVKGGEFVKFDPSNNVSEGDGTNFLADGYGSYELEAGVWTVLPKTTEIQVASEAALWDAATHGGNVVLAADINLEKTVDVVGNLTIDLNGKTVTVPANAPEYYRDVFYATGTANLTINGHGNLISEDGYTIHAAKNSNIVLNGGYYYSTVTSVYATKEASVTINGGKYQVDPENNLSGSEYGYKFTLNLKDEFSTTASITVKGGEYYKFNPANNAAEGENTNFVATGYKSVQNGDWYTVMAE